MEKSKVSERLEEEWRSGGKGDTENNPLKVKKREKERELRRDREGETEGVGVEEEKKRGEEAA